MAVSREGFQPVHEMAHRTRRVASHSGALRGEYDGSQTQVLFHVKKKIVIPGSSRAEKETMHTLKEKLPKAVATFVVTQGHMP